MRCLTARKPGSLKMVMAVAMVAVVMVVVAAVPEAAAAVEVIGHVTGERGGGGPAAAILPNIRRALAQQGGRAGFASLHTTIASHMLCACRALRYLFAANFPRIPCKHFRILRNHVHFGTHSEKNAKATRIYTNLPDTPK